MKIEVMILGEQRAGKTLYLAGLHGAMGSAQAEIPVTLRINDAERVILDNVYSQAIRPDDPKFPANTPWGVKEWLFDCIITGVDNREYTPFSVAYSDYAGEMINPHMSLEQVIANPGMQTFFEREKTAHAFLILIDGHKMYRFLKGDQALAFWLDDYLPRVLQVITRGRPVHLVLTKSSVLTRESIALDQVQEALLAQQTLRAFIEFKELRRSTVRLIPVDVLGPFAQLNDEGEMVKVPQARVAPVNLRVPFAALLPDIINHMLTETSIILKPPLGGDTHNRRRRFPQIRKQTGEQVLKLLHQNHKDLLRQAEDPLVKFVTGLLSHGAGAAPVRERRIEAARRAIQGTLMFAEGYMAQLEEQVRKQQEQLRYELNEKQARIDSERAALDLAVAACNARLQEFERQYPDSILRVAQP